MISGIFNDVAYDVSIFKTCFFSLLTNGVVAKEETSTSLKVSADSNMKIKVSAGYIIIDGIVGCNPSDEVITLDTANASADRIDRIVARLDNTNKSITLEKLTGIAGETPTGTKLTNDGTTHELCLAEIYVEAGATVITADNITDTRLNNDLCGLCSQLYKVDTSGMQAQFDAWFKSLVDILDNNVAATLANRLLAIENGTTKTIPVSESPPEQETGAIFYQVTDSFNINVEGGDVQFTNAVISDSEPVNTDNIWFNI